MLRKPWRRSALATASTYAAKVVVPASMVPGQAQSSSASP